MAGYSNILVVVDPAMTHGTAYARGVALARKTQAALTLLLVDHNSALARARFLGSRVMNRAIDGWLAVRHRWLETEVAKLQEQGIPAKGIVRWHRRPHEEIAREALVQQPDLVIRDAGAGRMTFSAADRQLVRLCPAPLMLVNAHSSSYPQRILAAVDPFDAHGKPAELNDHVLHAAHAMAARCEAPVHVVHVHPFLPAVAQGMEAALTDPALFEEVREEHRREFMAFCGRHGIPIERMHLLEGRPAAAIAELAEALNADLVVLGSVQRNTLQRALVGSTAEDVLDTIRSDVLVLKPGGFIDALRAELESTLEE